MHQSKEACTGHERDGAHSHEKTLIDEGGITLSLMEHCDSLVASYDVTLTCSLEEAQERLVAFCARVGDAVYGSGGIVGHIKAIAQERGASLKVSYTYGEPDITALEGGGVSIEGVSIVLAVEETWFASLMEQEIRTLAGKSQDV